jgi:hypothetical protein
MPFSLRRAFQDIRGHLKHELGLKNRFFVSLKSARHQLRGVNLTGKCSNKTSHGDPNRNVFERLG